MDAAGRILVSPPLRQFASLSKDVVLLVKAQNLNCGMKRQWNLQIENALTFKDGDMPPELDGFLCDKAVKRADAHCGVFCMNGQCISDKTGGIYVDATFGAWWT